MGQREDGGAPASQRLGQRGGGFLGQGVTGESVGVILDGGKRHGMEGTARACVAVEGGGQGRETGDPRRFHVGEEVQRRFLVDGCPGITPLAIVRQGRVLPKRGGVSPPHHREADALRPFVHRPRGIVHGKLPIHGHAVQTAQHLGDHAACEEGRTGFGGAVGGMSRRTACGTHGHRDRQRHGGGIHPCLGEAVGDRNGGIGGGGVAHAPLGEGQGHGAHQHIRLGNGQNLPLMQDGRSQIHPLGGKSVLGGIGGGLTGHGRQSGRNGLLCLTFHLVAVEVDGGGGAEEGGGQLHHGDILLARGIADADNGALPRPQLSADRGGEVEGADDLGGGVDPLQRDPQKAIHRPVGAGRGHLTEQLRRHPTYCGGPPQGSDTVGVEIHTVAHSGKNRQQRLPCHGAQLPDDGASGGISLQQGGNGGGGQVGQEEQEIPGPRRDGVGGVPVTAPEGAGFSPYSQSRHGHVSLGGGRSLGGGGQEKVAVALPVLNGGFEPCAVEVAPRQGQGVGEGAGRGDGIGLALLELSYPMEDAVGLHHVGPSGGYGIAGGHQLPHGQTAGGVAVGSLQTVQQPQLSHGGVTVGTVPKEALQTGEAEAIQRKPQFPVQLAQMGFGGLPKMEHGHTIGGGRRKGGRFGTGRGGGVGKG